MDDFGLVLKGGDLAFVINNFADMLQEFVRTYLLGKLNTETKTAIQSIVNDLLSEVPTKAVVEGGELEVDYALVG